MSDSVQSKEQLGQAAGPKGVLLIPGTIGINGVAQGDTPYASVSMIDDDQDEYIEWDVTNLVQSWLDGDFPNLGKLLRNTSSGAGHRFYSREQLSAPNIRGW